MLDHKGSRRLENETYEEYRERRKRENKELKKHLKGKIVWASDRWGSYKNKKNEKL